MAYGGVDSRAPLVIVMAGGRGGQAVATLETTTEQIRRAVEGLSEPLGSTILIDLGPAGAIHIDGTDISNESDVADLVLSVTEDDFRALGRGELDPMVALMTGRLKVSNVQLAMDLRPKIMQMFEAVR